MQNRFCMFLAFLFLIGISHAQTTTTRVESSIVALNAAMISRDKPALDQLTSQELSYGHSTGVVQSKSEFVNDILSGPVKFLKIDMVDQHVNLAGDIAIVRSISAITGMNKENPMDLKIGVLMIWKKENGNWKLLARQGYKLP